MRKLVKSSENAPIWQTLFKADHVAQWQDLKEHGAGRGEGTLESQHTTKWEHK